MSDLDVTKRGKYWDITITSGPSTGMNLGKSFNLKCEAETYLATVDHLPWSHVSPSVQSAVDSLSSDPLVTVTRQALVELQRDRDQLSDELVAHQRVLLMVNGSAIALQDARNGIIPARVWEMPSDD